MRLPIGFTAVYQPKPPDPVALLAYELWLRCQIPKPLTHTPSASSEQLSSNDTQTANQIVGREVQQFEWLGHFSTFVERDPAPSPNLSRGLTNLVWEPLHLGHRQLTPTAKNFMSKGHRSLQIS